MLTCPNCNSSNYMLGKNQETKEQMCICSDCECVFNIKREIIDISNMLQYLSEDSKKKRKKKKKKK